MTMSKEGKAAPDALLDFIKEKLTPNTDEIHPGNEAWTIFANTEDLSQQRPARINLVTKQIPVIVDFSKVYSPQMPCLPYSFD